MASASSSNNDDSSSSPSSSPFSPSSSPRRPRSSVCSHKLNCVFCDIISHHEKEEWKERLVLSPHQRPLNRPLPSPSSSPSHSITPVLYSTPFVVVFSPRIPAASRHLLIVPRKHIPTVNSLIKRANNNNNNNDNNDPYCSDDDDDDHRPRGGRLEEEKELSSELLLLHLKEVGELVMNNPSLLKDVNGGKGEIDENWYYRWFRIGAKEKRRKQRELLLLNKQREEEMEELDLNQEKKANENNNNNNNTNNNDNKNNQNKNNNNTTNNGNKSSNQENKESQSPTNPSSSPSSCSPVYRFHVPPFNSIDHLHLHCFLPPFTSLYKSLAYTSNTPWCANPQQILNKISSKL